MNTFAINRYETSFLLGLLFYTAGQFLIFVWFDDIKALHAQEPIDYAHWFMLLGVLCLVPQTTRFPSFSLNLIGVPLLILGIGLIVGMCVLDFVFWSIKSSDLKQELVSHLKDTSSIWVPFMSLSGYIFNIGLLMLSLGYLQYSKVGMPVVLLGTVIIYTGGGWLNVIGYLVVTAGFAGCFLSAKTSR